MKKTDYKTEFRKLSNEQIAEHSSKFFKTQKGEYGYGDIFLGIRVPIIRKFAKKYIDLSYKEVIKLIKSEYHEERLLGLIILVYKFEQSKEQTEKKQIYNIYIDHFKYINNWDLVDTTCPKIVGQYLFDKDRKVLYQWIKSKSLWVRRIAVLTNWWFIKNNDLNEIFKMAQILLTDDHDLIHKAVGWMLREAGKKDINKLEEFLHNNYKNMPRTMLRYSIEKLPPKKRQKYLQGKIEAK